MNTTRRNFIKNTAFATTAVGVAPTILNACASPGEKVTVALIGCLGQGFNNLKSFLKEGNNVECVALCDVDNKVLEERALNVEEITGSKPRIYNDFRRVLEAV